jgi:protein-disulfide isomerase
MVFCFIALIVFGIMGIFSATHRSLAKEAFDCVFHKITLTPCQTGLDQRLKAKLISRTFDFSPGLSKLLNVHFELASWLFFLLTLGSLLYGIWGFYNWYEYGNCDGPQATGFCIYNSILGGNTNPAALKLPPVGTGILYGPADAKVHLIQFGCFSCPFTKEAEVPLRQVLLQYGDRISYEFKPFPLPTHPHSHEAALGVICGQGQNRFWDMRHAVFERQDAIRENGTAAVNEAAAAAGLDMAKFAACIKSPAAEATLTRGITEGNASGIYGTPTFFINGKAYVGPQSYEDLKRAVEKAFAAP